MLEINQQQIVYEKSGVNETVDRFNVLLIEFKNGLIEVITPSGENAVYDPKKGSSGKPTHASVHKGSYASLNTLALTNADISAFYEYIPRSKKIGFGIMGAYNFNLSAVLPNLYIAVLSNSKKNYDLGVTFNYYPTKLANHTNLYFGAMIKYTNFSFTKETRDSVYSQGTLIVSLNYKATRGSQLATMITCGTHTNINDLFYVKTILGLGAFGLKGDYKYQINYELNKNNNSGTPSYNRNFLPKAYLGLNIGVNF